jgi:hypothetical protein
LRFRYFPANGEHTQQEIKVDLCRNCGQNNFLVESKGKAVTNRAHLLDNAPGKGQPIPAVMGEMKARSLAPVSDPSSSF